MSFDLRQLETFSLQPGVYIMKDSHKKVLYVGKAKSLRLRIKQYFAVGGDGRLMIPFLVSKVREIETIIVTSEKEALLLENNLIKQYQPQYNALLKDDKTYVALKVNIKHPWPMVQLVRYREQPEPDGIYFGPYTSAQAARSTLDLINRIFPLRECSDQELVRRTRPCILYDMKRCIAPCVLKCTKEEYDDYVSRALRFLRGHDKEVLKDLYQQMAKHAEELEFEHAATVLRLIRQIEQTLEGQKVDKPLGGDTDVLGIYRQGFEVILMQLFIRNGKLIGSRHYNFTEIVEDDAELISSFLLQHYGKERQLPEEILLPVNLSNSNELVEILSASSSRKVRITTPQKGDKYSLVEMAYLNAESAFKTEKDISTIRERTLLDLQDRLNLSRFPRRIECFDNSNIFGTAPVSVMVAFTDGEKDKKRYRKYKVKTITGPDDYGTFYEVLRRRFLRAKEEDDLPDLLIVDGGKGHLNIALNVIKELDLITVEAIAIAKEEGRHDKGIVADKVFLPNVKDPVNLKRNSPALFLLQQIRDEAHRFAVTFHRLRRSKATIRTSLIDIPGIGEAKSKALLRHFGSVKKIKEATDEELSQVKGISKSNIETIRKFLTK